MSAFNGKINQPISLGILPTDPSWHWFWRDVLFCLDFRSPNTTPTVGNDYDQGPSRMGAGGRPASGGTGAYPFKGRQGFGVPSGAHYQGNLGLAFPGGAATGLGTGTCASWDPTSGVLGTNPRSMWLTNNPDSGFTMAFVWSNETTTSSVRRLLTWRGVFGAGESDFEAVNFIGSTSILRWRSLAVSMDVPFVNNQRSVFVLTGRPGIREVYQDGNLLGSSTAGPSGPGDRRLLIGFNPAAPSANTTVQGYLELFVSTRSYWTSNRVRAFSVAPFAFLEPWRIPPFPPSAVDPCRWFDPATGLWLTEAQIVDWFGSAYLLWLMQSPGAQWMDPSDPDWFTPKEC